MRKVKNSIKKMMALCLAAIMTLAMATTAFAAETHQGNLTVNVNEGNTLKGQTIKVYKLFDLTVSDTHYAYTVNAEYKDAIATALGLDGAATSEALYEALVKYTENSAEIQKFAKDFTTAALTAGTTETKSSGKLGEVTQYKFENLDYGYYLVYQTGTKEIQSSLVSVDEAEATVNLKGQAPSIDKTANAETVEIGQVVTYTIQGTIPDTTGYESYVYKIHDTLTNGLDFVTDANGTAPEGTSYNVSVKIGEGNATSQTAVLSGDNKRTMTLDLSEWIRSKQDNKGQEFTVTYYAKVNDAAVVKTNNSAHLEYGNDPNNITTTTPDVVKTPTYPLDVNKTDTKKTLLGGAVFRLYRTADAANTAGNDAIKVTGDNGSYVVDPASSNMDMTTNATVVSEGYNLHLNGLAAGDYWLVETQAPDGYNKLTAPIKVTITNNGDEEWSVSKNGTKEDDKIIDIENSSGTILPETGGMGTVIFTVIAVVMILGIAVSFVISRRKRA